MRKTPINLQELRQQIYLKAKSDQTHRFWGIFVHVAKIETLREAYRIAKRNDGAPGIDGQTFEAIETLGVDQFLSEIREELLARTYRPQATRPVEIPKSNGKTRRLQIPCIRDRVVQGALKLILEAIFEADFCNNSYGFRPKRSTADAIEQCFIVLARSHAASWVLEGDIRSCFDSLSGTWLQDNTPMDKGLLAKWLAAGYIEERTLFPTFNGVPQGGLCEASHNPPYEK